ncbi:hypothetical protein HC026_12130 [Lactobacillus sp. LC28-10]|uniref:Uncharacterized protein n=1 Tax=Secundilactobacillus angelensis TaxID=2722706 RepID=A0ABX1L2F3_9LACO|nr:hypothetical protein [Secundilactobacillus angelensis]MCH5463515.1 hypothetical protein [Secundilactobacillus angelensis]NLR19635.1 hypothetical protein [Secundilactobacillus angelensis]
MKPGDRRKLFILKYLSKPSLPVTPEAVNGMLKAGEKIGESSDKLLEDLVNMDFKHDDYLTAQFEEDLQGNISVYAVKEYWITTKGENLLYELQNPETNHPTQKSSYSIGVFNNNGNAAVGDNNAIINTQTLNIDNSIHQLLSVKDQLSSDEDKAQLEALASELRSALNGSDTPKPHFLSKFKNFFDKSWKIISPVVTPLLVEIAKRMIF